MGRYSLRRAVPAEELIKGSQHQVAPAMEPLDDDLLLKVYPKIIGSVATIEEFIPPGATKSFRSSPLGFAEFSNLQHIRPGYISALSLALEGH